MIIFLKYTSLSSIKGILFIKLIFFEFFWIPIWFICLNIVDVAYQIVRFKWFIINIRFWNFTISPNIIIYPFIFIINFFRKFKNVFIIIDMKNSNFICNMFYSCFSFLTIFSFDNFINCLEYIVISNFLNSIDIFFWIIHCCQFWRNMIRSTHLNFRSLYFILPCNSFENLPPNSIMGRRIIHHYS